jgi:hypothetical protein
MDNPLIYDVQWQQIRVHMLNRWTNIEGIRKNLQLLDEYLLYSDTTRDEFIRLYRILNALNAVRMSFHGTGHVNSVPDKILQCYREGIQDSYRRLSERFTFRDIPWSWDKVKEDLVLLYQQQPSEFDAIYTDLKKREYQAKKRNTLKNRPSLIKFLKLIEEVINENVDD